MLSVADMVTKASSTDDIGHIRHLLSFLVDKVKDKDKDGLIEAEWKALAMVLDRIFFWMTTITAVVMIPTFLVQPPQEFEDIIEVCEK